MKYIITFIFPFIFVVLLICGCSPNQKLGGKVSFSDGTPLTCGTIIFSNDSFLARANINPDGSYDVGSLFDKDGLPPGKYKVYFVGAIQVTGKRKVVVPANPDDKNSVTNEAEEDILSSLVADKFTNRETTPLIIEVPGSRVYNITVEKP
jgi:hypothetical protein